MNEREPPTPSSARSFEGCFSDIDPSDVPDNMMWRQVNLLSEVNGQLTTRGGLRVVTTEELD